MAVPALSHRDIGPGGVVVDAVIVESAGLEMESPEYVPDWDYATPLQVRVDVIVDLSSCLEDCGLTPASELGFSVVWHASGSGLRGATGPVVVQDGRNSIGLDLAGEDLGGTLALQATITLLDAHDEQRPLTAYRPGSRLWAGERKVRLEGAGSRFPISHLSFAESGLADGLCAAWLLLFESRELFDSGVGNLRLYVNTDHARMKEFVEAPDGHPDVAAMLRADINRQLVLQALSVDDLDMGTDYPSDSLGELLQRSFGRNFPGSAPDEVRAIALNSPGEFEAILQARGGFLL